MVVQLNEKGLATLVTVHLSREPGPQPEEGAPTGASGSAGCRQAGAESEHGPRAALGTRSFGAARRASCTHTRQTFGARDLDKLSQPGDPGSPACAKAVVLSGPKGCRPPDWEGTHVSSLGAVQTPGNLAQAWLRGRQQPHPGGHVGLQPHSARVPAGRPGWWVRVWSPQTCVTPKWHGLASG